MKKNKPGWYHDASNSHDTEIKFFEDDPFSYNQYQNFWSGPFKTFGEAKKDAIGYFRSDINDARWTINRLRGLRRKK